jgi:sugar phosphate isomerase/epimerase
MSWSIYMDRRAFLGTVVGAALFRNGFTFAERKIEKIGVQLYTIRNFMMQDFEGALAKVSQIGYKEVELAGFAQAASGAVTYWSHTPQQVLSALKRYGLAAPSTHVNLECLNAARFPRAIEASQMIGNRFIVMPWIDEKDRSRPDFWKRIPDVFNSAGEACKKAGIQFAYHNHWFEFLPVNKKLPYDLLLENCDHNLVKMQLDLCWIYVAGGNPVNYLNRYSGRFPLVHVKDIKKFPPVAAGGSQNFGDSLSDMADVGSGIIDWKSVLLQCEKAGVKHYIVEHDNPAKPFESIFNSYTYLEKLRF